VGAVDAAIASMVVSGKRKRETNNARSGTAGANALAGALVEALLVKRDDGAQ
jgi:hypothetical protein